MKLILHTNNFPHKLLLTDTQISGLCKAFANGSPANRNYLKIQLLYKMVQSEGFIDPEFLCTIRNGWVNNKIIQKRIKK